MSNILMKCGRDWECFCLIIRKHMNWSLGESRRTLLDIIFCDSVLNCTFIIIRYFVYIKYNYYFIFCFVFLFIVWRKNQYIRRVLSRKNSDDIWIHRGYLQSVFFNMHKSRRGKRFFILTRA